LLLLLGLSISNGLLGVPFTEKELNRAERNARELHANGWIPDTLLSVTRTLSADSQPG